jgi:hypothetical protein
VSTDQAQSATDEVLALVRQQLKPEDVAELVAFAIDDSLIFAGLALAWVNAGDLVLPRSLLEYLEAIIAEGDF